MHSRKKTRNTRAKQLLKEIETETTDILDAEGMLEAETIVVEEEEVFSLKRSKSVRIRSL